MSSEKKAREFKIINGRIEFSDSKGDHWSQVFYDTSPMNDGLFREVLPGEEDELAELKAENARLREALGFYAEQSNWIGYHRHVVEIVCDSDKAIASDGFEINLGGRRAREALARKG